MDRVSGTIGEELINDLLDAESEMMSAAARFMSTSAPSVSEQWLNSELDRGTHPAVIASVLIQATASMAATIQAHLLAPNDDETAIERFVEIFRKTITATVPIVRRSLMQ